MKQDKSGFRMVLLFVLIQMILYVTFLTLDLTGTSVILSRNIKYSVIILCFCFALFYGRGADKGILFCMKAGLLFTLISDLFIVILDYYVYGVLTFIIVQQFYGVRLILSEIAYTDCRENTIIDRELIGKEKCGKQLIRKLFIRISFQLAVSSVIGIVLWSLGVGLELLLFISIFYFVCIVSNAISAVRNAQKHHLNRADVIFAVGMVLFLLCDINVGLFNLSGFITLPQNIYQLVYSLSSILMWTFYAPSQVLIALSVKQN